MKVIECNPRFIAPHELFARSGVDVSLIAYDHLAGRPVVPVKSYRQDLGFWYPVRDFLSFLELRRKKKIRLGEWLMSLFYKQVLPYFRWSDPWPSIKLSFISAKAIAKKAGGVNRGFPKSGAWHSWG